MTRTSRASCFAGTGCRSAPGSTCSSSAGIGRPGERPAPVQARLHRGGEPLEEMKKPTIASIHGACLGLGAELALACDLRVMAERCPVRAAGDEARPDPGRRRVEPAARDRRARQRQGADHDRPRDRCRGGAIGWASRTVLCRASELERVTEELVEELLAAAPLAVGLAKGVLDAVAKPTLGASLELEVTTQQTLIASAGLPRGGRGVHGEAQAGLDAQLKRARVSA